jgi:hypothetical protein
VAQAQAVKEIMAVLDIELLAFLRLAVVAVVQIQRVVPLVVPLEMVVRV